MPKSMAGPDILDLMRCKGRKAQYSGLRGRKGVNSEPSSPWILALAIKCHLSPVEWIWEVISDPLKQLVCKHMPIAKD